MSGTSFAGRFGQRINNATTPVKEEDLRRLLSDRWVTALMESKLLGWEDRLGYFRVVPGEKADEDTLGIFPTAVKFGGNDGIDYIVDCDSDYVWMIDYLDGQTTPLLVARSPDEFFALYLRFLDALKDNQNPDAWYAFAGDIPPELAAGWDYHEINFL